MTEIESLEELDRAAARADVAGRSMSGWQVQGLDLTGRDDVLRRLDPRGSLFLGCTIAEKTAERLRAGGALIFPRCPTSPSIRGAAASTRRPSCSTGWRDGYDHTIDAVVYAWTRTSRSPGSLKELLAQALHDSSIDDALQEFVAGRRSVGIMGGHALTREDPAYAEAAHLAHQLAGTGLTVATGGGPGAMEAANLGARLADHTGGHPRPGVARHLGDAGLPPRRHDLGTGGDRSIPGSG